MVDEFALIFGLNYTGDYRSIFSKENSLINKYFGGIKKINKQSVQKYFVSKRWDCDVDCLKITLVYFIELFLFSSPLDRLVSW